MTEQEIIKAIEKVNLHLIWAEEQELSVIYKKHFTEELAKLTEQLNLILETSLYKDLEDFHNGTITKERLLVLFQYLVDTAYAYNVEPLRKTAEVLILLGHITNTWNDWSKHQTPYCSFYIERKKALSLVPPRELC